MNEELSSHTLSAQKAVADLKQVTTIRKITIEALSPVIAKLEEHITYLLNQTSSLRFQNANLTTATANHKQLEDQIVVVNDSLQQMGSKIISLNHQKDIKLQMQESQSVLIRKQINKIKDDLQTKQKRIDLIANNNELYLKQIQNNKREQINSIEQLKIGIERYYQKQIRRIDAIGDKTESVETRLAIMEENRIQDQQQMMKINRMASLYQYEREDIRKGIDKATYLEHNTVMLNDYEKDKKYQNIQNELVKTDIKNMLNEALTPEIRHFLPILIKKLEDLNSFDKKLCDLTDELQFVNNQHKTKLQELQQASQITNKQITQKFDKDYNSLKDKLEEEIQRLDKKIIQNYRSFQEFCHISKEQTSKRFELWNQNLIQVESTLKVYIEEWSGPFLQRKKHILYSLVEECRPRQQIQENEKLTKLVYSMQPLLNRVKIQLQQANQQFRCSKETLNQKLALFNNQIVKLKTDIIRQTLQTKRILENYQARLDDNKIFNLDISQMIAALTQTILILYSLSFDQHYLQLQHEVYVTYNDGILCQVQNNYQLLNYRRKSMHPQLLKRAVMTQMVKFIDSTILEKPQMEWNIKQNKPSHFFNSILKCYVTLYDENIDSVANNRTEGKSASSEQKIANSPVITQSKERSARRKFISNNEILSQTIDFANLIPKPVTTARYQKQEQPYMSNRRNIRLKKLQKKDI